jgi:phospholipid transport system substrate-binding protein
LLLAASAPGGVAAGEPGPMEQVRQSTDKLLAILKDAALKAPDKKVERRQKIYAAIDERFNWSDMAQRTLARHWAPRTQAEREEFTRLFNELLRRTYTAKIEGYAGEKLQYKGERIEGAYARVEVVLVTTRNVDIPMEYSVRKYDGGGWLIYDVAIEGVKLVNNYRTQFASMLNSMSYPQFIEKLKAKVAETKDE